MDQDIFSERVAFRLTAVTRRKLEQWAKEQQLQKAISLLGEGMLNSAVAKEVFLSESQLCSDFLKYFGVSPQSFRPMGHADRKRADVGMLIRIKILK